MHKERLKARNRSSRPQIMSSIRCIGMNFVTGFETMYNDEEEIQDYIFFITATCATITRSNGITQQPMPSSPSYHPSFDYDESLNDNEIIETVYNPRASIGGYCQELVPQRFRREMEELQYVKNNAPTDVNLEQFCKLVDFWYSDAGRHRSHAGKQNRSLQTTVHTAGSKSFARYAHELANGGDWTERFRKFTNFDEFRVDGSIGWSPSDRYAQVIGPERHGRIRGVGLGPTPSSHPTNTNDLRALHVMLTSWKKRNKFQINRAELYKAVHSRSDGSPINPDVAKKIRRMEEIELNDSGSSQTLSQSRMGGSISWSPSDRYAQVMGPERHGRIRGVGLGPTPSSHPTNPNIRSTQPESSNNAEMIEMQDQMKMMQSTISVPG
ncbi:hypothetical protein CJ030_MR6G028552 [Morella rubra]|uniref:Uncharacterized protein n=1 Tax=Morella rubra TaxID=262757 RepID=A0A6A1VF19_9ROSI|nr:hypothetical protein CJ030_MR6G028552 [Morella rubra]